MQVQVAVSHKFGVKIWHTALQVEQSSLQGQTGAEKSTPGASRLFVSVDTDRVKTGKCGNMIGETVTTGFCRAVSPIFYWFRSAAEHLSMSEYRVRTQDKG